MTQEELEANDWWDDGQDYFDEDAYLVDPNDSVYDVEEYDHVLANYRDAKSPLFALKTARGFFPVVAVMPNQMPHNPSSSRVKGEGKGKHKLKGKSAPSSPVSIRAVVRPRTPGHQQQQHLASSCVSDVAMQDSGHETVRRVPQVTRRGRPKMIL